MCKDEITRNAAHDGIHDNIEFNEYQTPEYWMKRRARRAFIENIAPAAIVIGLLLAFLALGILEVNL